MRDFGAFEAKVDEIHRYLKSSFCDGAWFSLGTIITINGEFDSGDEMKIELTPRKFSRILKKRNVVTTASSVTFICPMSGEYDYVAWSNTPAGEPIEWIPLGRNGIVLDKDDRISITPSFAIPLRKPN